MFTLFNQMYFIWIQIVFLANTWLSHSLTHASQSNMRGYPIHLLMRHNQICVVIPFTYSCVTIHYASLSHSLTHASQSNMRLYPIHLLMRHNPICVFIPFTYSCVTIQYASLSHSFTHASQFNMIFSYGFQCIFCFACKFIILLNWEIYMSMHVIFSKKSNFY